MQSILDYRSSISADKLYDAEKEGAQLRALVLKRDYTYADTGDLDAQIAQLQSQLQTLRSQAAGSVRRITAPQSGLYSAVVDGYESVLTPQSLAEMTPSQLNTLQPAQTDSTQVGKLVLGESWYYAAVMSADAAQELQEQAQELKSSGRQLYLRFTKGVDQDLPVTIASVGPEENGRVGISGPADAAARPERPGDLHRIQRDSHSHGGAALGLCDAGLRGKSGFPGGLGRLLCGGHEGPVQAGGAGAPG